MGILGTFLKRTNFSLTPILTPMAGGKAMMYSPTIVIGYVIMILTGQQHEEDCDCEICQYQRDDSARQQVLAQRRIVTEPWTQIKTDIASELAAIQALSGGSVSRSEAQYWADYMAEHFGEPFRYTLYEDLLRDLVGLPESMVGETLLSYLYDAMPQLWLDPNTRRTENDPEAAMQQVLYLASMTLVGSER